MLQLHPIMVTHKVMVPEEVKNILVVLILIKNVLIWFSLRDLQLMVLQYLLEVLVLVTLNSIKLVLMILLVGKTTCG